MFLDTYKALCLHKGVSADFAAKEMGFSHSAYGKWKNGALPQTASLVKIAQYFDVPIEMLTADSTTVAIPQNTTFDSKQQSKYKLPIYGSISAGHGVLAEENIIRYTQTDEEYCNDEYFWLTVYGKSMEPMLFNNDLVLIHKQPTLEYGNIGVFLFDGEGFVKKYMPENYIRLHSLNESFPDIVIKPEDADLFQIIGKVVEIKRKV